MYFQNSTLCIDGKTYEFKLNTKNKFLNFMNRDERVYLKMNKTVCNMNSNVRSSLTESFRQKLVNIQPSPDLSVINRNENNI